MPSMWDNNGQDELAPHGLAFFDFKTGVCTAVVSTQARAGELPTNPLIEAAPVQELGEMLDMELPSRRIIRFGQIQIDVAHEGDHPAGWLRMADGQRLQLHTKQIVGIDKLVLGQLWLSPGWIYVPENPAEDTHNKCA